MVSSSAACAASVTTAAAISNSSDSGTQQLNTRRKLFVSTSTFVPLRAFAETVDILSLRTAFLALSVDHCNDLQNGEDLEDIDGLRHRVQSPSEKNSHQGPTALVDLDLIFVLAHVVPDGQ